jgi:hypothetical protein
MVGHDMQRVISGILLIAAFMREDEIKNHNVFFLPL